MITDFSQHFDKRFYPDLVHNPERLAALKKINEPAITKGVKDGLLEVAEKITSIEELAEIDQTYKDSESDW